MPIYREISDRTYAEAGQVIRAAAGRGERAEFEVLPGFDMAVAATAISLAEGAPHAFSKGHASAPSDYLTEGREEWRHFHVAVARAIDQHRSGEEVFETSGDVMRHMAGDVLNQADDRAIVLAATNSHPAFLEGMSPARIDTVEYIRSDPEALADARHGASGRYDRLPEYTQRDIRSAVVNGNHLTQPVDDRIARFERLIHDDLDRVPDRERSAAIALGDFGDFGKPLFNQVTKDHLDYARKLVAGEEMPWNNVDRAIVAHAALVERGDVEMVPANDLVHAYARELADKGSSGYEPILHTAARIESDVRLTRHYRDVESRMDAETWNADSTSLPVQIAQEEHRSSMTPENQIELYTRIHSLHMVSGLSTMRLAIAGEDVERGDLLIGRARELADRKVTFEGIERSEHVDRVASDMFLPGDAVRLDPARRIVDFDHETAKARLGVEPLIVTKSIIEGVDVPNGMGGASRGMRASYEVGGVEGRFPAHAFQHERGENHEYGVLAAEAGRLWFVPMDPDAARPTATGAAREVTQAKVSEHVGSLETMKGLVGDGPAAGEFVTIPEAFGRRDGPVELVGAPWWSDASKAEADVASAAIREASGPSMASAMGARQAAASLGL